MRNKFEEAVAAQLGAAFSYETHKFSYVLKHIYTPDFVDVKRKIIVEAKGYMSNRSRAAYLAVRDQHPEWKFYFVFQRPDNKIDKCSKTTYRQWAVAHGFGVMDVEKNLEKRPK